MNIVEVIRRETVANRDHIALIDGSLEMTYGTLLSAVDQVTELLAGRGLKPLDRVAFLCEDSADYVTASLAILKLGAVVIPVSPSLMGDELEVLLDRMEAAWVMADRATGRKGEGGDLSGHGLVTREFTLERRAVRSELPPAYAALNPAFIRFSSGTTGDSKGVLLSHETIVARTDAADQGLRISSADTVVWVLSMSFHFVVTILLFLRRSATIVICRQPFPESFLEAAKRRQGTVFYASPFHYQVLASSPLVPADALAGVRLAVSTAMKLSAHTAEAFRHKFKIALAEGYGIIELGLPFLSVGDGRGSVGQPQRGYEIRIEGPDEQGSGRILIRGPGMFDAYVSPWKSRGEVLVGGWFDTGDVGRLEADGALTILGRVKNIINFAGMKIFPQEVEEVVTRHPAVAECRVSGEPHPLFGQIPVAEVVFKAGLRQPDAGELRRFCFGHLSAHKVPKAFHVGARLERTASGKIKR